MKLNELYGGDYDLDPSDDPTLQKLYQAHAPEGMEFEDWMHSEEGREIINDYYEAQGEQRDPYGHRGLSRRDFM